MKTVSRIIRTAAPIAVILVGFTAMAAFAGTGDQGALAGVQQPAQQGQNAVIYLGVVCCVVGFVGAWMMWLKDHNLGISFGIVAATIIATVAIKNSPGFIAGIAGVGATF
jgi:hypothetical protein